MVHEVFICYDERDEAASDAIYHVLEDNNIKSWIKSKCMSPDDPVDKITAAIEESECFLLIFSKNSTDTNYVITETDIAFSRGIPIVIFNIDGSKLKGNMEFILQFSSNLYSFPDCRKQLENLVGEISNNGVDKAKIDLKYLKVFEKTNPKRMENIIKKYVKIAIPIIITLCVIYLVIILPMGQKTTDDGILAMHMTYVDLSGSEGNYKYVVHGESYNLPVDKENYFMNIKFFDENDNMLYEINSTADEFKSGIICTAHLKSNNVTHIDFKLTDLKDNELFKDNLGV